MIKALIRLTLVITIPLMLLVYTQSLNPINLIRHELNKKFYVDSYRGTFYLIKNELNKNPMDTWPSQFEDLSNSFSLPIRLLKIQQDSFSEQEIEQLHNQKYVYLEGEPPTLLQKINNSQWAIEIALENSRQALILQQTKGTIDLLEIHFSQIPQRSWPEAVELLAQEFGIELSLTPLNKLDLPAEKMQELNQQGRTSIIINDDGDTVYHRLSNSDQVLIAGPISLGQLNVYMITSLLFLFITVIVLGLLTWLVPLWRDLKALDLKALQFGSGHLDSRVHLKSGSVMARLGSSFNKMAERIQKMINTNQQLTNSVAHDLRTPLARLKFALEILENEECNEEEQQRYQKSIHSSIDSLDYLINQTLIHARYSRAADVKTFSSTNLAELITDEFEQHSRNEQAIQFSLHVDDALADTEQLADPRAIIRALSNLISNAKRFANSKVQVSFKESKTHYFVLVEDDGTGIETSQAESIFQPFSQLNNNERSAGQGHGLGLAIVHQIALWHKGDISVKRSSLGGACFELRWPRE